MNKIIGKLAETNDLKGVIDVADFNDPGNANPVHLDEEFHLSYVPDLIARKLAGAEQAILDDADTLFYEGKYHRPPRTARGDSPGSTLPEAATAKPALQLLLWIRIAVDPRL